MKYTTVSSDFIESIGWDDPSATMVVRIKLKNGRVKVYTYHTVPKYIYLAFLNAPSHGTFYNHTIKGQYA